MMSHKTLEELKKIGRGLRADEEKIEKWWHSVPEKTRTKVTAGATAGIAGSLAMTGLVAGVETGNSVLVEDSMGILEELGYATLAGLGGVGATWWVKHLRKKQEAEQEKLQTVV
jgi:hypothetical protein